MAVLPALKALGWHTLSAEGLAAPELVVPENAVVDEKVGLRRRCDGDNQGAVDRFAFGELLSFEGSG
jgi:hypothetical protein